MSDGGTTRGLRARVLDVFDGVGIAPGDVARVGKVDTDWTGAAPPDGEFVRAAVLVPLVDRAGGMTVLLTQRTAHLNSHAGQISFPGGRVEQGDGTPEETALRETEEEIGLARRHVELVGRLHARQTGTGYHVVPVVGLIDPPFALAPDPGEVAEVFELPLDFVLDPANHRFETRIHGGVERQFHAMTWQDFYIWGLTARLLVNLSQLLRA